MSKVKVSFSTVICDENFSVLDWVHGSWIDVDVRVEFLNGDFVASVLQQSAQGCSGDAFAQG